MSEKLRFLMVFFYSRSATFHEKGIFDSKVADCYESVVSISSDATFLGATEIAVETAGMLAHSARAALGQHGYVAILPTCRFVGRLLETVLIAKVKENQAVEAAAEATVKQTFIKCLGITLVEQEKHQGCHLEDPMRLLTKSIHEYVHGDRNMVFEEKSRTFARTVPIQEAREYLVYLDAKFVEWAQDTIPPATA